MLLVVHPLTLHAYTGEVIPAQAGIQSSCQRLWIPAFAGMTSRLEASRRYGAQLNGKTTSDQNRDTGAVRRAL